MLYMTDRQKQIISNLYTSPEGITIGQLEKRIGVSRRTIYREFEDLRGLLARLGIELASDKRKYSLQGNNQDLDKIKEIVNQNQQQEVMTISQRESALTVLLLLRDEPQKILQFALDLNVSEATIKNDLDTIERTLRDYNIQLVRHKGVGIYVECDEIKRRQMLIGTILSQTNEYTFFRYLHGKEEINDFFLNIFDLVELNWIKTCLDQTIFEKIHPDSDRRITELILTFAISLMRIKKNQNIKNENKASSLLKYQGLIYSFLSVYTKKEAVKVLPGDVSYLASKLLASDKPEQQLYYDNDYELNISLKVKNFIRQVSDQMNWDFQKNPSFVNRLTQHVLALLSHHVSPLPNTKIESLDELSKRFNQLFEVIKETWQVKFPEENLTTSELQLLLLYFANEYTSRQNVQKLNVLVICENGIGTSAILSNRLKQEFPEIKQIKLSKVSDLPNIDIDQYELIVSTLELNGFSRDYELVSPLLLQDEIDRIKLDLRSYEHKYVQAADTHNVEKKYDAEKLSKISIANLFCLELVNGIKVKQILKNSTDLEVLIRVILDRIDSSLVKDKEQIAQKIISRIKLAPIGLPNSNMALLHTSGSQIKRCMFLAFDLEQGIEMEAMDHNQITVTRMLLMLGPERLSEDEQAVMSMVSSMIVMNDNNLKLFNLGSQDMIKDAIANQYLSDLKASL